MNRREFFGRLGLGATVATTVAFKKLPPEEWVLGRKRLDENKVLLVEMNHVHVRVLDDLSLELKNDSDHIIGIAECDVRKGQLVSARIHGIGQVEMW